MDISPLTGVCFAGCKIIHLGGSSSATTRQTTLLVAVLMKRIIPDHWDLIIQSTPNCISPRRLSHSSGGGFLFGRVNLTGDKDDLSCLIASHCVPTGYVVLVGCRVFLDPSPQQYSEEEENKQNSEPSLCVFTIILLPLFI